MKIAILVLMLTAVPMSIGFALDGDILTYAKDHPAGIYENRKSIEYGNPNMIVAVKGLSDCPRPWTVTKILSIFRKESDAWISRGNQKLANKDWNKKYDRLGYLATILAASRDPRAFVALGEALEKPHFPNQMAVIEGFYFYKPAGGPYRQIPVDPNEPWSTTNFATEMIREVQEWWDLNKARVAKEAAKMNVNL